MKVLTSPTGSVLILSTEKSDQFLACDDTHVAKGIVATVSDIEISRQAAAALKRAKDAIDAAEKEARKTDPDARAIGIPFGTGGPFAYLERKDVLRDIRFITRAVMDVPEGTEVGVKPSGRNGVALDIPQTARKDRAEGIKKGSKVAVGPNIAPKTLMNAHGVVDSINGKSAMVTFDEGDIDRLNRATGRTHPLTMKMPKATLEVIA